MSLIKIEDIAFVRFGAPDVGAMRTFLTDFGLGEAAPGDADHLYMRGSGDAPVIHITEKGPPGFRGLGLRAGSVADLGTIARAEGAEVQPFDAPGGGSFVRLTDPNGITVDVVAGQAIGTPQAAAGNPLWNFSASRPRSADVKRVPPGPAVVTRLGHAVLLVDDLQATWAWWQDRFGLLISDEVRAPDDTPVALFVRCDRGALPTDHHTLNFATVPGKPAGFHHAAFEVADMDSLMVGHDHLKAQGYQHEWGIGRHILGSQVFDYWRDPFGNRVEHWTDGDVFPAHVAPMVTDLDTMLGRQWGPPTPANFV